MNTGLEQIRIVLVEPAGPLNVGAIARVMKNFGLRQLVLVNPQCDPLSAEARLLAVHAADVLEAAQQVATLSEALTGCQRAVATTGRDRTTLPIRLESPQDCLPWLRSPLADGTLPAAALIFGREDSGLTNAELNLAQRFVQIPTSEAYASMNLAQAVAVCCYELAAGQQSAARRPQAGCDHGTDQVIDQVTDQAIDQAIDKIDKAEVSRRNPHSSATPIASLDTLEAYFNQLEALLLDIGYLYPHTAASRMEKFRRLFLRAQLSEPEVAMLRGVLSQMKWAIGRGSGEVRE
ncbi:RNA methyltransferase [Thermoleptolyngbya sichuanensis A183]|uniref:tRNA (cytidine/uridine-2'-O-)-methyltransferase TrmJ n=1 Tax=Thermoleptolyngbya sichuanensis A183 TaxID=2737172 RepID=A0A6M8BE95_9CYAN|nr:RNA methyltransferase [Thermoleptolyngbya sp. PKUAC-SCTB121]QKD85114.1 RNA methyltransferase [Thermoleptolyngbya sichuanensis A183]